MPLSAPQLEVQVAVIQRELAELTTMVRKLVAGATTMKD